jgi:hypothetical protein
MALVRVVSGSRSIYSVLVTLLFVFICRTRRRQLGGEGELGVCARLVVRLTHEGGASHDASLFDFRSKRSTTQLEHLFSSSHDTTRDLTREARRTRLTHPRRHPSEKENTHNTQSDVLKYRRDVIHLNTGNKGLFYK